MTSIKISLNQIFKRNRHGNTTNWTKQHYVYRKTCCIAIVGQMVVFLSRQKISKQFIIVYWIRLCIHFIIDWSFDVYIHATVIVGANLPTLLNLSLHSSLICFFSILPSSLTFNSLHAG